MTTPADPVQRVPGRRRNEPGADLGSVGRARSGFGVVGVSGNSPQTPGDLP
jgi:hypothetical protein